MSDRASRATRYRITDMPKVGLWPITVMLLTAGCAGSMGTIHTNPAPVPVATFDGSYRDTIRIASTTVVAFWCDTPGQPFITVANGQFTYVVPHINVIGSPAAMFPAVMAPDGSFQGNTNDGVITGHIDGTHIEGRLDGEVCIYTFSGERT